MIRTAMVLALCLTAVAYGGEPAPTPVAVGWRGNGTGLFPQAAPPTEWSQEKNVAWKTAVGWSYSSPIVVGDKVVTTSEPNLVTCVNLADGKVVWEKEIKPDLLPKEQQGKVKDFFDEETSGNTAPTPVSDGKNVYAIFGNGMIVALTLVKGDTVWARHVDLAPTSDEGRSASPLLVDGKLIVHLTDLFALDPANGKVLWQQAEAPDAYGSPAAGGIGAEPVVATPKGAVVRVADGKVLATGLCDLTYASPVIQDGVLYTAGATCAAHKLPDNIEGDKITPEVIWSYDLNDEVYSSPAIVDGKLYVLPASAELNVFDLKTKEKVTVPTGLEEGEGEINLYASATVAGKHLYLFNSQGVGVVFEPGAKPKLLKTNSVRGVSPATPAIAGKRMILRAGEDLYCISE